MLLTAFKLYQSSIRTALALSMNELAIATRSNPVKLIEGFDRVVIRGKKVLHDKNSYCVYSLLGMGLQETL